MKINGKQVPLIVNPNGEGKIVDMDAVRAQFDTDDAAWLASLATPEAKAKRYEAHVKSYGDALAVKAPWYPIFEEATHAFWVSSKQFMYDKITSTTVIDMIFTRIATKCEIAVADYASVKGLFAEFLAENTSQDHDPEVIMWKDATKGPGAKPYFNPHFRARFLAHQD